MYFGCYLFCYAFAEQQKRSDSGRPTRKKVRETEKQQWQQKGTRVFRGANIRVYTSGLVEKRGGKTAGACDGTGKFLLQYCFVLPGPRSIYFHSMLLSSCASGICRHETINVNCYIMERFYNDFCFCYSFFCIEIVLCCLFLLGWNSVSRTYTNTMVLVVGCLCHFGTCEPERALK